MSRLVVCGVLLCFTAVATALEIDCNVKADLFFVIDGSDSLSDSDFAASKNFMVQVLKEFDVQRDRIHVGANVFGTDVYDRIQLYGPSKIMYRLLEKRIETLQRTRSGTATFKAIEEMRKEFADRGRAGVTKVGIVITDGKSVNINATGRTSRAAQSEGVNMIAIGVGDNIFRPELNNIASAPSSVYETGDIMDVVETIQRAIKEYICIVITTTSTTTTKLAPTSPDSSGLKDYDCPDCMIDGTHGFMKHPHSCEKYIEIIADEKGNRTYINRKCRDGLFWDQYYSTCRRPEHVECDLDPCLTVGVASYDAEDLCSAYVMCVNRRSMRACCPINHAYEAGKGCVLDPTCISCDGDDNRLIHPIKCDKIAHPTDDRYYIQNEGEGHENKTMPCAPGTVFNYETCMCDLFDSRPDKGKLDDASCTCSAARGNYYIISDCNPTAKFMFEKDFTDSAGHAYAGTEFVDIIDGHAQFNGNGMMNIYRFSMDSFREKLVLRIRFKPSPSGKSSEALLTNCIYSEGESSSISIKVVRSSKTSVVVFSTDTTLETQQLSIPLRNTNVWNEVTYMYDGSKLYGIIDDGTDPVLVQTAPLSGDILIRKSGIILAAGSQMNSFTGDIDQFELYKCFPAFAEGYRA